MPSLHSHIFCWLHFPIQLQLHRTYSIWWREISWVWDNGSIKTRLRIEAENGGLACFILGVKVIKEQDSHLSGLQISHCRARRGPPKRPASSRISVISNNLVLPLSWKKTCCLVQQLLINDDVFIIWINLPCNNFPHILSPSSNRLSGAITLYRHNQHSIVISWQPVPVI